MKRNVFLSMLFTTIGSVFALSGCGSSGKITITIGMWPESQQTKDLAMFDVWKDRFEAVYPQYDVEGAPYTYSVDTVNAKAQANKLPTVFQTWFTEPSMLVANNYIKDITGPLTSLGWLEKMDSSMRSALTFDGKTYGVPRDGYGLGLVLNLSKLNFYGILPNVDENGKVDLYDKDGKPMYPTTFEELYEDSQIINELSDGVEKGLLVLSANKNGGWQFSNMAWNFGAELEKEGTDGKWVGTLNDARAVEALEWVQKMAAEGLLLNNVTLDYSEWYSRLSSQVDMAIVGNDVLSLAITNGGMNKDDLALVPMPKGPYGDQYSLFGGTPFVFAANATDDQVTGALRFLEFMGRSPETSDASKSAIVEGDQVAIEKGMPILPTVKAWSDPSYLNMADGIENDYINVDMNYYNDFFNSIYTIRHAEVPYCAQDMYTILDGVLQEVLMNPDLADCQSLLTTANATFNSQYMSKL
jgi:ABC-type glycerol-3-phosphate transport system substrate-binding protein